MQLIVITWFQTIQRSAARGPFPRRTTEKSEMFTASVQTDVKTLNAVDWQFATVHSLDDCIQSGEIMDSDDCLNRSHDSWPIYVVAQ
jgi:hypothetical protein